MALDSAWWYQTTVIAAPGDPSDSAWKYQSVTVRNPHTPIGVLVAGVVRYVPILTWSNGELR